jgi:glycosyltransferase involved in cell wall biosynthesis
MSAWIGADVCSRLGIPFLWTIHESVPPGLFFDEAYGSEGYRPELRRLGLSKLRAARRLIFEADATLRLYEETPDDNRLLKIPYGVDFQRIDEFLRTRDRAAARRQLGFDDDELVLISVGSVEPRKAQIGLVIAFADVAERYPRAKLVLVGDAPGPYSTALHGAIERLHLGNRVRVVPVTADIFTWYLVADAVLSASDLESMPRSLIEAMGFGVIPLATDVFGVGELIDDGRTGFLMTPRDLSAMVDGLDRLLALSAVERQRIGRAAAESVRRSHDASGYREAYRTLLRELHAPATRGSRTGDQG